MSNKNLPIIITIIVGLLISLTAFFIVWEIEKQRAKHNFREIAQEITFSIRQALHFHVLEATAAFIKTAPELNQKIFEDFGNRLLASRPDIISLQWVPKVLHHKRSDYEAQAKKIIPTYQFIEKNTQQQPIPAEKREIYFPIYYFAFNQEISHYAYPPGFDYASSELLVILKKAQTFANITVSPRIQLPPPPVTEQFAVILVKPIYHTAHLPKSPQAREKSLKGFVLATFRICDLITRALGSNLKKPLNIYVEDLSAEPQEAFLYYHRANPPPHKTFLPIQSQFKEIKKINVASRIWQITFTPASYYPINGRFWLPFSALGISLLLTALIIFHLRSHIRYSNSLHAQIAERHRTEKILKETQLKLKNYNNRLQHKVAKRTRALQEAHEQVAIILDSLEAVVCVTELQSYRIIFVNQAAYKFLNQQDLINKSCLEVFYQDFTFGNTNPFCQDTQLINANGELIGLHSTEYFHHFLQRWYLIQTRAIRWTSGQLVRLEIISDISERKQIEEVLRENEQYRRTLIEESLVGLVLIRMDEGNIFEEVNPSFARSLGYKIEELIGRKSFWDLTPEKYLKTTRRQQKILQATGRCGPYEKEYIHKEGYLVPVRVSGVLIKHRGHAFLWKNIEDISDQKRVKVAEEARLIAEQANRTKTLCLANMSHELRTPLNGILGYAQILNQNKTLSSDVQEGLDVIQRSGEYLLTLITDILDLSKIEAGKLELNFTDFAYEPFIKNIVELFKLRAGQKGLKFIYRPLSEPPQTVYSDQKRLRQIIINLISNAIKFTEEGFVLLEVSYQDRRAEKIQFRIQDTGIGIATEELENIFVPFQQSGDVAYRAEGTGLGLAITKTLVQMLEAEISVDSEPHQGSQFIVTVHLPEVASTQNQAQPKIIGYEGPTRTILVVDDKWDNRMVLRNMLTSLNFQVFEAGNGQEALAKVQNQPPDMILMDLVMPRLDGYATTEKIREIANCEKIPIIAVTANLLPEPRQRSQQVGCNDFIGKPVNNQELIDCLQKHLKLTWQTEQVQATSSEQTPPFDVELTPEDTLELYDLAMCGNVKGIITFAEMLQNDENLTSFGGYLYQLAKELKLEQIYQVAQHYRNKIP